MSAEVIYGNETWYEAYKPRTQVYRVTHDQPTNLSQADWDRKKFMYRSFISFSFGGKWIEDWNLIAITENDRIQRNGSANFEDFTSDYTVIDGQFYWGSHYLNNQLNLTLMSDGMTQMELDDFLHWFCAGHNDELILAEHPNRVIYARISTPPVISMLPFEHDIIKKIHGREYKTKTTLYKGNISLSFTMDEPFWYSKVNLFGRRPNDEEAADKHPAIDDGHGNKIVPVVNEDGKTDREVYKERGWVGVWDGANGEEDVYTDTDAIKVVAEDGIPTVEMLTGRILLGNNVVAAGTNESDNAIVGAAKANWSRAAYISATVDPTTGDAKFALRKGDKAQLYYPGTAPTYPQVKFKLTPRFNSDGYIDIPFNSFTNPSKPYNSFYIQGPTKLQEFRFSLPGAYLGVNQAIKVLKEVIESNKAYSEIRQLLRDNVTHLKARAWAIAQINNCENGQFGKENLIYQMQLFIRNMNQGEDTFSPVPALFSFDSKTGKATGTIGYRNSLSGGHEIEITEEDVGDMVRSEYLKIDERNYPNPEGDIVPRGDKRVPDIPESITNTYSHEFYHDVPTGLEDVTIHYKYMYY